MPNRLKELRTEKGLTLKEFASSFNSFLSSHADFYDSPKKVSYATISRWENGKPDPTSKYQEPLSDYFDVDIGYLLGITDFKNQSEMENSADDLISFMKSRINKENENLELTDDEWQEIVILMGKYSQYTNVQIINQLIEATLSSNEWDIAKEVFISGSHNHLNRLLSAIKELERLFIIEQSNSKKISDIDNYRFEKILLDIKNLSSELRNKYGYNPFT